MINRFKVKPLYPKDTIEFAVSFMAYQTLWYFSIVLAMAFASCKKFVEIDPPKTEVGLTNVFADSATASSAIKGIYSDIMDKGTFASGGNGSVTYVAGLSSDEFYDHTGTTAYLPFAENRLLPTSDPIKSGLWDPGYKTIYQTNLFLEALQSTTTMSSTAKSKFMAEAKFVRAFCHFILVNLFGDVPIVITSDYRINNSISRSSQANVYTQIIADLKDAQSGLPDNYIGPTPSGVAERVRPNKGAATALLARVYLYNKDWANAEAEASKVINSTLYSLANNLNDVFLKNSSETIWQLKPVISSLNTWESSVFIPVNTTIPPSYLSLSAQLIGGFESGDNRKTVWVSSYTDSAITYYYPYKYKIRTPTPINEYSMVLRLAEQFLIRSEARAQQNKLLGPNSAEFDINVIRNRAGLPNTIAISQQQFLSAIEQERRLELFSEWGHRWFDLKRMNRADAVLGPLKGANWQPTDVFYPMPQADRNINPNLSQNPGYH